MGQAESRSHLRESPNEILGKLPNEIVVSIFRHLDCVTLASLMHVSRGWHQIISTTTCWPVSLAHVPNSTFPGDFEKQFQLFLKDPLHDSVKRMKAPSDTRFKVVFVGERRAGKTSLVLRLLSGSAATLTKTSMDLNKLRRVFPSDYIPTVFDNTDCNLELDGRTHQLALWDTAGHEEYDRLRPLSYPGTDLALLCFSVASREQFDRVRTKFLPEVRKHVEGKPPAFLLVGCQADRRLDVGCSPQATVSYAECLRLVVAEGLAGYVETSALAGQCVDQLLQLALLTVIDLKVAHRFHELVTRPPGHYATLAEIRTGTIADARPAPSPHQQK
ncbi:putative small GTPase Rac1 [Paratrimastix pyriformis]|uniref:Small GTPase Rac1 n=1 Tax=Paratrimastix pyriformis TaxID=342808 RepID=A0ABQ8UFT6_9EUKA|nr:putative small GTPase Rac1 [Paratrimastix pyriformis]